MLWGLISKILVSVLVDLLIGLLVKAVLAVGSTLYKNYFHSQQTSFA